MIARCHNEDIHNYEDYGGRGIKVCYRWNGDLTDYENFCQDMGDRPEGCTLDRIDPDGNYEPSNCRWATATEQANNKRNTVYVEFEGQTKPLGVWAEQFGMCRRKLYKRIVVRGWKPIDAFELRETQLELNL